MRLGELIGILARRKHRELRHKVARSSPRPFQQLRVLWWVAREPDITQALLAERICIDAPAASRLVNQLVDDGLVERRPGRDRRSVQLRVTRAAASEVALVNRAIDEVERELPRALSAAELRQLMALLRKMEAGGTSSADDATAPPTARRAKPRATRVTSKARKPR